MIRELHQICPEFFRHVWEIFIEKYHSFFKATAVLDLHDSLYSGVMGSKSAFPANSQPSSYFFQTSTQPAPSH
jgi:hypothetical protein